MFSVLFFRVERVDVDVVARGGEVIELLDDVAEFVRVGGTRIIRADGRDKAVDTVLVGHEVAGAGGEFLDEGVDLADFRLGGFRIVSAAAQHADELACLRAQLEEGGGVLSTVVVHRVDLGEPHLLVVVGDDGIQPVVG